jgi:hypothetical protein
MLEGWDFPMSLKKWTRHGIGSERPFIKALFTSARITDDVETAGNRIGIEPSEGSVPLPVEEEVKHAYLSSFHHWLKAGADSVGGPWR